MAATQSSTPIAVPGDSTGGNWPTSWLVTAASAALLVVVLVTLAAGPIAGVVLVGAVGFAVAVIRYPILALVLPVLAPLGFIGARPIPGAGGLQVIHLAVAAAVGGLIIAVAQGSVEFRVPIPMAFGLLFIAAMFASTIASDHPVESLRVSVNYLLGVLLAMAVAVMVRGSRDNLLWLLRGWVVAAFCLIVPALPSALLASEIFGGGLVEGRVQGAFAQPNDYGEFCLLSAVIAAALLAGRHAPRDRWLGFAGLVAGVAGAAVSFSRGTWLGAGAALLTVAVLSPKLRRWVFGIAAALATMMVLGSTVGQAPFPTLMARFLGIFVGSTNPEDDRAIVWQQAIRTFGENPVFGVGPGGYLATNYDPGSELILHTYLHGHSVILTTAAEVGLLGVITLLAFTISLAVATLGARSWLVAVGDESENATLAVLAGGLVGVAVHGLIDFVYTNPLLIPLVWTLAGLVAGLSALVLDQARSGKRPASQELARATH